VTDPREASTYDRKGARYIPPTPKILSWADKFIYSQETSSLPSLNSFWSWAFSDLKENTTRGVLAEFLVAQALEIPGDVKAAWEPYDLITNSGTRIEVKASGYLQAWSTLKHSAIKFGSLKGRVYDAETGDYSHEPSLNADIYVFCKHNATEHKNYNVLSLDQWEFFVIPLKYVAKLGTNSITEKRLLKDGLGSVLYSELKQEFLRVESGIEPSSAVSPIPPTNLWGPTSRTGWNRESINDYLANADQNFETKTLKALLKFAESRAGKIIPSTGKRPGFSFQIARPNDGKLVTIWTIRGYGPTRPLRLELAWGFIREGYSDYHRSDERFLFMLNEIGGAFREVEIGGYWPVLGDLSPLDVSNFQQIVLEFTNSPQRGDTNPSLGK
jgi:hypothetical protein